jgi:hypothetical protein
MSSTKSNNNEDGAECLTTHQVAAARRYEILSKLFRKGPLSIKDLRDGEAHRDFRKKYNAPTEVVLATDFSKLMDMVGGGCGVLPKI